MISNRVLELTTGGARLPETKVDPSVSLKAGGTGIASLPPLGQAATVHATLQNRESRPHLFKEIGPKNLQLF